MRSRAQIPTPLLLANIISFQIGWFACVLGAARGWTWQAPLLVVALAAAWLLVAPRPRGLALVLALTGVVGLCWDSALAVLGLIAYRPGPLTPPLAPMWILAMWVLFATTLQVSLRWLRGRWWFAGLLGAALAPLAYLGGERLGALQLLQPQVALLAQAAGWALLLPALVALAGRCDA
jgi:hypothetical protein